MSFIKSSICLLAFASLFSCDHSMDGYLKKREMANKKGLPKDSLAFYFSPIEPVDSSQIQFLSQSFLQNWIDASLYAFKEPVLSKGYLGIDKYRFLWLPSFHKPMLITIEKDSSNYYLNVKKLDRLPKTEDIRYEHGTSSWDEENMARGYEINIEIDTLENGKTAEMSFIKGRYAKITLDFTRRITKSEWDHFEDLLTKANFWNAIPYLKDGSTDGAQWVIEASTLRRYKYIARGWPEENIRDMGQYLVKLSGLKQELY